MTVYVEVKLLGFSWKAEGQPVIEVHNEMMQTLTLGFNMQFLP